MVLEFSTDMFEAVELVLRERVRKGALREVGVYTCKQQGWAFIYRPEQLKRVCGSRAEPSHAGIHLDVYAELFVLGSRDRFSAPQGIEITDGSIDVVAQEKGHVRRQGRAESQYCRIS